MAQVNGIIDPPIDDLLEKVESKYALVVFASQRARQINDYYTDLHDGNLFDNVGPLVDASIDDKPLSTALHEIVEGKLEMTPRTHDSAQSSLEAALDEAEAAAGE
ncbi:DNA-directed RNA polymerase subunit omega [Leucobacter weissii]|uniref:DNA-directed RNA polymerase subunit omega n=1 Tax=Leucobacter weissii TaxID=1983706 RepID=A0A939MKX8_9MICO|nr:DNA-directed RNA polymerase subunit omega [Leucobacter weissii]MBO1902883.1 DNA-directed RNA polymerase subunit omega [Leucobacter weissii]